MVPVLSIITINYNNRLGLLKTMQSVVEQSFQDFEYLIIDGGSNDGSLEEILNYEQYLSFWCSEKDKGVYNAMNKGIAKATGEYLLFLNSGDSLLDNQILSKIVPLLKDYGIIYGDLIFKNGTKDILQTYPDRLDIGYLFYYSLGHPASFIRRDLLQKRPYSEDFKIVSDWEFFFYEIILDNIPYMNINQAISIFDTNGISSNLEKCKQEQVEALKRIFPGGLYDMIEEYAAMKRSPLFPLFYELQKTRKFQLRIKPLLSFLIKLNNFIGRKR